MRVSRVLVSLLALILLLMPSFPAQATGGSGMVDDYAAGAPSLDWSQGTLEATY